MSDNPMSGISNIRVQIGDILTPLELYTAAALIGLLASGHPPKPYSASAEAATRLAAAIILEQSGTGDPDVLPADVPSNP